MSSYCPYCNKNVDPAVRHECGDKKDYTPPATAIYHVKMPCPACAKLQAENAALRAVVDAARGYKAKFDNEEMFYLPPKSKELMDLFYALQVLEAEKGE